MKKKKSQTLELTDHNLLKVFNREKRPLDLQYLESIFSLDRKEKRELKRLLRHLVERGALFRLKNSMYGIAEELNLVTGTMWCTKSGNGFVMPDKENMRDIFIPARFMKNAFHGDTVMARVDQTFRGRKEGKIVRIIKRNTHNIIGFTKYQYNSLYIIPEDSRYDNYFKVTKNRIKDEMGDGELVAAVITRFPEGSENPECEIVRLFKNGLNNTAAITTFVEYKYNLPGSFKRSTEAEANSLFMGDTEDRVDLRHLSHVTIDGETAKDFDDAVYVEKDRKGYTLYVSIADVSAYVAMDSRLDREAYERGTSIYFPGKVLPMLPKALSNGLCSINPDEDKLALTVQIKFTRNGDIVDNAFWKSIIKSTRRLTYREVEKTIIDKDRATRKVLKPLLTGLDHMAELASLLMDKRKARGSLDFDLPEPEVLLDIEGGITNIVRTQRLFSHQLIEEFMVAANEAVARYLRDNRLPAMYRIHEPPEREKIRDIERLMYTLPIKKMKSPDGEAHFLQTLLANVRDTDYEFFVNRVLLRSMKQARYSPVNKGHFGLASECYLHFTSPIRRYPDLICHRSLKGGHRQKPYTDDALEAMATHLSERERVVMEAERELEDRIRILFMEDKVGGVYQGIISHITSYGFYVELNEIFVEGLVLLADLTNDYYHFEEEKFRLIGRRTRKVFRIGDKITIRVAKADTAANRLHFVPA